MEPILQEWENFARIIQPKNNQMNVEELRDHAEEMLRVICSDLKAPQTLGERLERSKGQSEKAVGETPAELHAELRLRSGFSIILLASEYRALRTSVLHLWLQESQCTSPEDVDDILRFNEAIDQALAESVARYSEAVMLAQDIFLGVLGHDLRAPLNSIGLGAQFLMHDHTMDSHLIQLGSRMHNSVLRMKDMLDDLLDFTQTRIRGSIEITPHETDIAKIAEQVIDEFRSSNPGRTIRSEVVGNCKGVWDAGRIGQVYQNLIGNALQYGAHDSVILVAIKSHHDNVTFSVHNHGEPIPKHEQDRMFDLMHRVEQYDKTEHKHKNLGLGLYIVREIVNAHQGEITVYSAEGEGTTFTVKLPRKNRRSTARDESESQQKSAITIASS